MSSKLSEIAQIRDSSKRLEACRQHWVFLLQSKDVARLIEFAKCTISSSDTVISRPSLSFFASNLRGAFGEEQESDFVRIVEAILEFLGERSRGGFIEAAGILREGLSKLMEQQGEFSKAARILARVSLDAKPVEDKVRILVHIAHLFLAVDEPEFAASYANKAGRLIEQCENASTHTRYLLAQAIIFDISRRFLKSSQHYHQLSLRCASLRDEEAGEEEEESEEDHNITTFVQDMLRNSAIACVLAPVGQRRSQMLSVLFKDERTRRLLASSVFPVMKKMYLGQIVRPEEERQFEEFLSPHHKVKMPNMNWKIRIPSVEGEEKDGGGLCLTILRHSIIEHNLAAVSRIYKNVSFDELGTLLGVNRTLAERIAARRIAEDRLDGYLDQVDGIVYFVEEGREMRDRDERIGQVYSDAEAIVQSIARTYPRLVVADGTTADV